MAHIPFRSYIEEITKIFKQFKEIIDNKCKTDVVSNSLSFEVRYTP